MNDIEDFDIARSEQMKLHYSKRGLATRSQENSYQEEVLQARIDAKTCDRRNHQVEVGEPDGT